VNRNQTKDPGILRTRFTKLIRLARHPSLWGTALKGTVPSLEHEGVPFGDEFSTVIDVGASRGQFASFATHRFPGAKVFCFEPLDEPAAALERALGQRAEVRRVALGSEPGTATIHISARDDSSSLLPIGERQVAEFPGTAAIAAREIAVSTLDREFPDRLQRPCLLKIDVQGLEADVLRGGPSMLEQVDEALIECSFVELYEGQALAPEVVDIMKSAGFALVSEDEDGGSLIETGVQADLLFRRAGTPA